MRATARACHGALLAVISLACPVVAQQPTPASFAVDHWNTESGLPQTSVNAILQSRDGYLWLATLGGVARFDGTSFFAITTGNHPGLRSDRVTALAQDSSGRIWIGTEEGLSRFDHNRITTYTTQEGLPGNSVTAIAATPDGAVWFGTSNGALGRVDRAGIRVVTVPLDLFGNTIGQLIVDRAGAVWVSARTGIWRIDAGAGPWRPTQLVMSPPTRDRLARLALDPAGTVWAIRDFTITHFTGTDARQIALPANANFAGDKIHLIAVPEDQVVWFTAGSGEAWRFRIDSATLTRFDSSVTRSIVALTADREGSLWIGDRITGLTRVRSTLFRAFAESDGLAKDNTSTVFVDSQDRVWAGARCGGASVTSAARFRALDQRELPRCVLAFAEDTSGAVWIGGGGVVRWRNGVLERFDTAQGIPTGSVNALFRDHAGTMWIGTAAGLASWNGRAFKRHDAGGRFPVANLRTITETKDGALWIGTMRGLLRYKDGVFDQFSIAKEPANDFVRGIHEDARGDLWLATYGGGLARFRAGKIDRFTTVDGLYDNFLSSVTEDRRGNMWLSSNRGVFRIARRDLDHYTIERKGRLHSVAYGRADGMASSETNGGFQSSVARTSDGRLWYPTLAGVAVIDPARAADAIPPTVALERITVDGKAQDSTENLSFAPGSSVVEIAYSGLSLNAPSAVTFGYRLEPWDRDWIDGGTRRSTTYSRLPPGHYRFRLVAANRDGVWGADTASITFSIEPHYWQTWWFRLLAGILLVAAAVGAYLGRVRQVRAAAAAAERSASQRRVAVILESITDGFFALDREWHFTYVNGTAQRLLARPAAELLGNNFWNCFPGAENSITESRLRQVIAGREPVVFEAPDTPERGRWLEVHAYPTDDGISVYFSDVTDRKNAEEELRNQKEEIEAQAEELAAQTDELSRQNEILEENVRLKDDVERIARHDLRSPVNTIISLAQIVREDGNLAAEHDASLQLIEQAGYRVLNMASLTLDLFKMEQGTYELIARPIDVRAVAERTLLDLQAQMRTREVTAVIVGPETTALQTWIRGDELLAHAMLTNIVKNAVEASPRGARVTIEIVVGERVQVRVHNVGVIPDEVRARLFQKYVTAGKQGGTGLGSYSARLMARTLGGEISVDSSVGRGTTVTIELLAAESYGTPGQPPRMERRLTPVSGNWPPRAVLVVDDDADNRAVVRHFLKHPRWTVDEAENGPLAVSRAAERHYDLILMDIEMPVMDGFAATARIRAAEGASSNGGRTRIVAFSSHDDAATRQRALDCGCDEYLVKPATRQVLVAVVLHENGEAVSTVEAAPQVDPALRDLIPEFLERKGAELDALRDAVQAGDGEAVRRGAHRLRGTFGLYGFDEAATLCATLEELARDRPHAVREGDEQVRALYTYVQRLRGDTQ